MFKKLDEIFSQYDDDSEKLNLDYLYNGWIFQKRYCGKRWIDRENSKTYLYFRDNVGRYKLSGNELIHYPELAQYLRSLKHYPELKLEFDISHLKALEGAAFVANFAKFFNKYYLKYMAIKKKLDAEVNNAVVQYSKAPGLPKVSDAYLLNISNSFAPMLVLNGVEYLVPEQCFGYSVYKGFEDKAYQAIDLSKLLTCSNRDSTRFSLSGGILQTPLIRVRYREHYAHKGREKWIDLNDRCMLNRSEAMKKARTHYAIQKIEEMTIKGLEEFPHYKPC